ncbi:hypothetical protein B0I35DRAFT_409688 [Stachybotrys elegans]|uniref:Uncharacterized protein n=1 Tax=Stachybotrys elegans TaxID=80388 RepID=A0A8K0SU95_9HYPO|nr:hypothetical protein B0I35DRAFT_409688 [Stachybotrys elegans]
MSVKAPAFPGFTPLNDQIYFRDADTTTTTKPPNHPDVVVIYGWGDGLPRHVSKYTDGFAALYPHARIYAILSPIAKAIFSGLEARARHMTPLIQHLFPNGHKPSDDPSILVHTMSNTGAVNFYATAYHFAQAFNRPFPHKLVIMDSTPGGTDLTIDNLTRWSRAMSLGTARFFPWPFVVTQAIWATGIFFSTCVGHVVGSEPAGAWARKASVNLAYEPRDSLKLYLYSKEDDLIGYEDIELHVAEAKELGWKTEVEIFEGTGHVGHMRQYPEQYWSAISRAWEKIAAA